MLTIPILSVPNQSLSVNLENDLYDLTIKYANGIMALDIVKNNTIVLLGARMMPSFFLVPYSYLATGNFVMSTDNEEYPIYTEFSITQFLLYLTIAEVEALRAGA